MIGLAIVLLAVAIAIGGLSWITKGECWWA